MITVSILINGHPIFTRSARNIGKGCKKGRSANLLPDRYKLDDGTIITHHRENGAVYLAKMMLDHIKEI
jgi:hypothetical protein